jgi:hypothetical protein
LLVLMFEIDLHHMQLKYSKLMCLHVYGIRSAGYMNLPVVLEQLLQKPST